MIPKKRDGFATMDLQNHILATLRPGAALTLSADLIAKAPKRMTFRARVFTEALRRIMSPPHPSDDVKDVDHMVELNNSEVLTYLFSFGGHAQDPCGVFARGSGQRVILRFRHLNLVCNGP